VFDTLIPLLLHTPTNSKLSIPPYKLCHKKHWLNTWSPSPSLIPKSPCTQPLVLTNLLFFVEFSSKYRHEKFLAPYHLGRLTRMACRCSPIVVSCLPCRPTVAGPGPPCEGAAYSRGHHRAVLQLRPAVRAVGGPRR
jgi:hypothetical protein